MKIAPTPRIIGVIVAVVAIGGGGWFGMTRLFAATPKTEYRTAQVQRSTITETVAVSGSVNAASQVRLTFKSGGKLTAVMVSTGQQVKAGDALAKLDDSDAQAALQQAQANLNSAQAKYDSTVRGDNIGALQQAVSQAQQSLDRLRANYAAAKSALDSLYYTTNSDRGAANLSFTSAQATLSTLQNDLAYDTYTADVRSAITTANTVQANFAQAQVQAGILDQALSDLGAALQTLKNELAQADAGNADVAGYNLAQTTVQADITRAQGAIDALNAPLGTALTNVNAIIANLSTTATKSDPTLNQTRTDAATLAKQISTASQQLTSARSRLGAFTSPLQTVSDAVSGSTMANAQNALANATQSLQTAQNSRDSDIQSALSSLQTAQTSVDSAQSTLRNLTLTAPVDGVVASVGNSVGEFVTSSASSPFILLSATNSLTLHGTIGEADVANLKLAQVATITVDAIGTTKKLTGKVTSIDPVATLQQGVPVYGIDVTLDVSDPAIRSGMTGTANVIVASKRDVLVVPNTAIRTLSGRRGVQVMENGQPVDVTDVAFGISNDQFTEVTSGLQEGQQVVLPTAQARPSGQGGGTQLRVPGVGGGGGAGR